MTNATVARNGFGSLTPIGTLFERLLDGDFTTVAKPALPLAVWQDEHAIHVEMDAPGVTADGVNVTVHNRELTRAAGSILGDEAMHWAVLLHALGEDPVPGAFVG